MDSAVGPKLDSDNRVDPSALDGILDQRVQSGAGNLTGGTMSSKTDEKALVEKLQRIPLFSGTTRKQRIALARQGKLVNWKDGNVGVKEGAKGVAFFLLLEGAVEVTRGDVVLDQLRAGNFFGETGLLTGAPRNADVTAIEDTKLFVLARPAFVAAVKSDPDIAIRLMSAMAERRPAID